MNKPTVVVCDHIHESGLEILKNTSDINYVYAADIDKTALLDVIKDADVCITRSSTDIDDKFLNAATNLKAVVRAGVGVDNVDIDGCSKRGVIAMNVPTANTMAATELTMTHLLSCMRKMPYAHSQLKDQRVWKREDWYGQELYGKKIGRTITNSKEFKKELEKVRDCGYGIDYAEELEGVHCVGAPIFNQYGYPISALWVTAPSARLPFEKFEEVGEAIRKVCLSISQQFGYKL